MLTSVLTLDAEAAKSSLSNIEKKISELANSIREIEKSLNLDFGPSNRYFPLFGMEFKVVDGSYTYSLKLFESAKQGHTSIGKWSLLIN